MITNQFTLLREANRKRQIEWDTGNRLSLSFRGNELAGETGELCNLIKKLDRERLGLPGSRTTQEAAASEIADVLICLDLIANDLGVDLWSALCAKFNSTSEAHGFATRLGQPDAQKLFLSELRNRDGTWRYVACEHCQHGMHDLEDRWCERPGGHDGCFHPTYQLFVHRQP